MMDDAVVLRAAEALRGRAAEMPEAALVLGSGLGDLADAVDRAVVVPTAEIEGYPPSTVAGHRGRLVFGYLEDVPVVIVQGRVHLYEGHSVSEVTFAVRLVHALGARRLVLTNAAGGINASFAPGTLMLIRDHINFAGAHLTFAACVTADAPARERIRAVACPYSEAWLDRTHKEALQQGVALQRGTYVWVRGPSYETKAEIAALRQIGADAVGMSTVPEALQATVLGMDVLGISTITNAAAGLATDALSHQEVLEAGQRARGRLEQIIRVVLRVI